MSKSPLSGAFAGSSEPAKKKKKNGALLLISGIALATSIGGVFAANSITINGGAEIEFGQGVASTNSCDTALTTSMTQAYTNNVFRVASVIVDGVNVAGCSNSTLRVSLLDVNGGSLDTFTIVDPQVVSSSTDRSSANVDAGSVKKITVTTEGN
jgi:hypothetical protein